MNESVASQLSRSILPRVSRPDFLCPGINFPNTTRVTVGNSGAIWMGAGGLTISCSRHPFRTAYLRFILIEHRYSLHSDQCFILFAGSVHTMCNDAESRLADIIYGSQTEQAGCDEWQSRIKMEQSVNVCISLSSCPNFTWAFCIKHALNKCIYFFLLRV